MKKYICLLAISGFLSACSMTPKHQDLVGSVSRTPSADYPMTKPSIEILATTPIVQHSIRMNLKNYCNPGYRKVAKAIWTCEVFSNLPPTGRILSIDAEEQIVDLPLSIRAKISLSVAADNVILAAFIPVQANKKGELEPYAMTLHDSGIPEVFGKIREKMSQDYFVTVVYQGPELF